MKLGENENVLMEEHKARLNKCSWSRNLDTEVYIWYNSNSNIFLIW